VSEQWECPECKAGKCGNCDGTALDLDRDEIVECICDTHSHERDRG
jgi:hypothetical protein